MKKILGCIVAILALALSVFAQSAFPQAAGNVNAITPLTRDLGNLITWPAASQGLATMNQTYVSATQSGYNTSNVACVYLYSSAAAQLPVATISIQNGTVAQATYVNALTSTVVTALNAPTAIYAGRDLANSSNVSASVPIMRQWRVIAAINNATNFTGSVDCSAN